MQDFLFCCQTAFVDLLNSRINCTIFAFKDWIAPGNNELPLCSSREFAQAVEQEFFKSQEEFIDSSENRGCPRPCTTISYHHEMEYFSRRRITTRKTESSYFELSVYYDTLEVEERTETLLYDLSSFLSASGGNLGLLMGFSCLSALLGVIKCLTDK